MLDSTSQEETGAQLLKEDGVDSPEAKKVFQEEGVDQLVDKMVKEGGHETDLPKDGVIHGDLGLTAGTVLTKTCLEDEHDMNNDEGSMDQDSDEDDGEEKGGPAFDVELEDPGAERNRLIAKLKVLDAMLQQVEAEELKRLMLEGPLVKVGAKTTVPSGYLHLGDTTGDFKRQRRPNPKYFDTEIEADYLGSGSSPPMTFRLPGEEGPGTSSGSDAEIRQNVENNVEGVVASSISRPTFRSFFSRSSMRTAGTHRARTALAQKPRVYSTSNLNTPAAAVTVIRTEGHLDNLSIRELHEAYRTTFGRDTSVKDKHWLKRQISMGLNKQNGGSGGKENNRGKSSISESNLRVRMEKHSSAEAPLSTNGSVTGNGKSRSKGIKATNTTVLGLTSNHEMKRTHRKTLSLSLLSPSCSSNPSSIGEFGGGDSDMGNNNEVPSTEVLLGGKRVRKPNRRYIEDEGDEILCLGTSGSRSILSTHSDSGNGLRTGPMKFPLRSDGESTGDGFKNGAVRSTGLRVSARSTGSHGRHSKHGSNSMKKKYDARAAKLVKMAHSARAARHDAESTVRKVKFRLPAAPGQDKGEVLNGGDGEQVSCLLPVLIDEGSGDHEILSSHYQIRSEDNNEEAVATVPTASGGTRRKHHRPWTLREVVTLVEGVARCGGGKWADIKKLAFSTVGYRTAVDLKDKWRNLLRASRAQLHPPKQGETRKKQFSAAIPAHILARVRELATLNNQVLPIVNVGNNTSRSGRVVHRR